MQFLNTINDNLWSIVIVLLIGCAVYFTFRSKAVQFSMIREMVKVMFGIEGKKKMPDRHRIGSFKAFSVSLASRVGTGNLAGVASALFIGGPGAVFWMWVMALFGAATAFVEATLAQLYKRRGADSFYGGPAFYIESGLHKRWMGILYAVLITLTFGVANQMVQSTTITDAVMTTFGIKKIYMGIVMAALFMFTIVGGINRISNFSSRIVPLMAVFYIILAITVLFINYQFIPAMFRTIFESAFGINQAAGGMVGVAVQQGIRRGLFSNEAGEGSAPNAAAIADASHPVKQGLLQALGVFVDTIIICTCTAMIILISGVDLKSADGIILTSNALEAVVGPAGSMFITIAVILFAYSSIVANYYYGETNIRFISKKPVYVTIFRILSCGIVLVGSIVNLQTAFGFVDIFMGLMTIVNLIAILKLSKLVWILLNDYKEQKKSGRDPEFKKNILSDDIAKDVETWD